MADWGGYGVIIEEARDLGIEDRARPLVLCPLCGNLLTVGERELNCDVGHYRAPVGTTAGDA